MDVVPVALMDDPEPVYIDVCNRRKLFIRSLCTFGQPYYTKASIVTPYIQVLKKYLDDRPYRLHVALSKELESMPELLSLNPTQCVRLILDVNCQPRTLVIKPDEPRVRNFITSTQMEFISQLLSHFAPSRLNLNFGILQQSDCIELYSILDNGISLTHFSLEVRTWKIDDQCIYPEVYAPNYYIWPLLHIFDNTLEVLCINLPVLLDPTDQIAQFVNLIRVEEYTEAVSGNAEDTQTKWWIREIDKQIQNVHIYLDRTIKSKLFEHLKAPKSKSEWSLLHFHSYYMWGTPDRIKCMGFYYPPSLQVYNIKSRSVYKRLVTLQAWHRNVS